MLIGSYISNGSFVHAGTIQGPHFSSPKKGEETRAILLILSKLDMGLPKVHLLSDVLEVVMAVNGKSDWAIEPILVTLNPCLLISLFSVFSCS